MIFSPDRSSLFVYLHVSKAKVLLPFVQCASDIISGAIAAYQVKTREFYSWRPLRLATASSETESSLTNVGEYNYSAVSCYSIWRLQRPVHCQEHVSSTHRLRKAYGRVLFLTLGLSQLLSEHQSYPSLRCQVCPYPPGKLLFDLLHLQNVYALATRYLTHIYRGSITQVLTILTPQSISIVSVPLCTASQHIPSALFCLLYYIMLGSP
jgi:hypothetical protein